MSRKPVRREDPDDADAEVISLTSRAQRRGRASAGHDSPRTLILQISHVRTDAEAHADRDPGAHGDAAACNSEQYADAEPHADGNADPDAEPHADAFPEADADPCD